MMNLGEWWVGIEDEVILSTGAGSIRAASHRDRPQLDDPNSDRALLAKVDQLI